MNKVNKVNKVYAESRSQQIGRARLAAKEETVFTYATVKMIESAVKANGAAGGKAASSAINC